MNTIDRVKHDGAAQALYRRTSRLLLGLTNDNWKEISSDGSFCRLGEAINDAENILRQMRETLSALQELEPDNH